MTTNKFNSDNGFTLDVNNTFSKINIGFDTNTVNPENFILGVTGDQTQFILVDPLLVQNTTDYTQSIDFKNTLNNTVSIIKNYVFDKLVDPSIVGCSNCDSTTNISTRFIDTGELPIINREIIAEFEINPFSYNSIEIDLVGHRKICNTSGQCYSTWINPTDASSKIPSSVGDLHIKEGGNGSWPPPPNTVGNGFAPYSSLPLIDVKSLHHFIDYSCCPCCDAIFNNDPNYLNICNDSSKYFVSPIISGYKYCTDRSLTVQYDDVNSYNTSYCDMIETRKSVSGQFMNTTFPNCNIL